MYIKPASIPATNAPAIIVVNKNHNFVNLALIPLGRTENLKDFVNELKKSLKDRKLIYSENLIEFQEDDLRIIVTSIGSCTRKDISNLRNKIQIKGEKIDYLIVLNQ